jgi:hypothetical protein
LNWKTTALLAILLAFLGALVLWQGAQEAADVHLVDERIFEGVEVDDVCELRIDNIERTHVLRLERDSQGIWYITDPLAYPADGGLVQVLLEDVARGRMMAVSDDAGGEAELGFDPPRSVLSVVECTPEGRRVHEVELGDVDLDGKRVFLRKDGRYYRALRRLATTTDREIEDFRSPRILHLAGREVVEFQRTGSVQYELGEEPEDLTVHAYLDRGVWRSLLPLKARLDPMDVGVVVFGAVRLEVDRFIEDAAPDLARYGLDKPLVRLSLGLSDGGAEVLLLSRLGNTSRWFVMREGANQVWSIDDQAALRLLYPFPALIETHFMTARRGDVTALALEADGRELRIERGPRDWTVRERRASEDWSVPLRADGRLVDDWLGRLETLEVGPFQLDGRAPWKDTSGSLYVESAEGTQGGQLGLTVDGLAPFLREDEEVVGAVPDWVVELVHQPRESFLSLELLTLDEVEQVGLVLARPDARLEYRRDGRGLWHLGDAEEEALELTPVLDPLLFLRAERYLDDEPALGAPISVTFLDYQGGEVSFEVGLGALDGGQQAVIAMGGARVLAGDKELHQRLLALFDR